MVWVRFPIWDRWKELTRFWIASESAINAEFQRWSSIPIANSADMVLNDPSGRTDFNCSLPDFVDALANHHRLYSMLLASYTGLVEEHGRNIIEYMISTKGISRTSFPNIDQNDPPEIAADTYIRKHNVETWGSALLSASARSWSDVPCGKSGVVEAFVVRNIVMHGLLNLNQTAVNRLNDSGLTSHRWNLGDTVVIDRSVFGDFVHNLRAFARVLADGAANTQ